MNPPDQTALEKIHRFLDEAGDTTFFGQGRVPMLGRDGVSLSSGLGMVKFVAPVAEVRKRLFKWIHQTDCSLEMVVGRKIPGLFAKKHNGNESEFYATQLSHLLKNKL